MPNRIIKESIRTSDDINKLTWFEEVLFYRLIVSCDDYGRFDGRPSIIKGLCFPLKDEDNKVTTKTVEKALHNIINTGMITLYEVNGKPYIQLNSWEKHQNVRAKNSKYPSTDDGNVIASANICIQMQSDVPVFEKRESYSNTNILCDANALFESLWKAYPNKRGKGQVSAAQKKRLLEIGEEEMFRAMTRYIEDLKQDEWRKPQNGSTFFNSGYQDYLDANYEKPKAQTTKSKNQFCNFDQREYDYDDLERKFQKRVMEGGAV